MRALGLCSAASAEPVAAAAVHELGGRGEQTQATLLKRFVLSQACRCWLPDGVVDADKSPGRGYLA
jgi:hypothetical protein